MACLKERTEELSLTDANLPHIHQSPSVPSDTPPSKPLLMSRLQTLLRNLPPLNTNPSEATKTFTRFPDLPVELKNKIWGFFMTEPRDIKLDYCSQESLTRPITEEQHPAPPILHVDRHAREEGLRYYNLITAQSRNEKTLKVQPSARRKIYINFDIDRFLFVVTNRRDRTIAPRTPNSKLNVFNFGLDELSRIRNIRYDDRTFGYNAVDFSLPLQLRNVKNLDLRICDRTVDAGRESVEGDLNRENESKNLLEIINSRTRRDEGLDDVNVNFMWAAFGDVDLAPCPSCIHAQAAIRFTLGRFAF